MRGTLMVIAWTIVLLALSISLRCQSVPDAPEPRCQRVTMDPDGNLRYEDALCRTFPEWKVVPPPVPKKVTYWTFRRSWQDPPLRTNKQQLTSKAYLISTIAGDISVIVACSRKNSREDFHAEIPSMLGVDFMAFLGGKFFTQSFATGPQIYKIIHYSIAAAR